MNSYVTLSQDRRLPPEYQYDYYEIILIAFPQESIVMMLYLSYSGHDYLSKVTV